MAYSKRTGYLSLLAGLVLTLVGQVLLLRNQNLGPEQALEKEATRVTNTIEKAREFINRHKGDLLNSRNPEEACRIFSQKGTDVFIYRRNQPFYWTSNQFNLKPQGSSGLQIQKHFSRYLAVWNEHTDTADFLFAAELIKNPEFRQLGASALAEDRENKFSLSASPLENSTKVDIPGIPLFYIIIDEFEAGLQADLIILLGLILFSLGIFLLAGKEHLQTFVIPVLLIFWAGVEWLFFKNYTLWNFKTTSLFAPQVYASSGYFPNLGVLLFNTIWLYFLVYWFSEMVKYRSGKAGKSGRAFLSITTLLGFSTLALFTLNETIHLIRDSSINFNFHEIHLIDIFTVLGLCAVVLWFAALLRLRDTIRLLEAYIPASQRPWVTFSITGGFTVYILYSQEPLIALYFVILCLLLFAYDYFRVPHKSWIRIGLGIMAPCLVTGMILNRHIHLKELEVREILAAKLLLQNEKEPLNRLIKTEQRLMADNGILDYYTCTDVTKNEFEKRLRQLYFSEYSEDFEMLVFDYNMLGQGYREENPFDYSTINQLYYSNVCKPITAKFSMVNERKLKGSYLGRFDVFGDSVKYGTYFVLLKPRMAGTQGRLAEMFNRNPLELIFSENQYSYAIYSNKKLNRRYGQYNYPVNYPGWKADSTFNSSGFNHFTYSDDLGNIIVISKNQGSILQTLTGFTVLGIVSLFITLIYYLIILIRQYSILNRTVTIPRLRLLHILRTKLNIGSGKDLFLSSKLQVYLTLVVFITFLVVMAVTVNYFRNSYSKRQKENLWNKTGEIANAMGSQANLDALFNKFQTGLIYDLSNYYSTDINLYDARGRLITSSNDRIYEQDILGDLMNPEAYFALKSGSSGLITDEQIGNLNYISAYYTIFDNDLNLRGYLNLPYFTNRKDLYREISYYTVTIINLFALVFALAALVAYIIGRRITEPLNLIRQQMGLVKLGLPNAPIVWEHNDEIGLLIAQYNKMLGELEDSTNRLAESERQGAWREMAKQVAHEIKNPLTPMKLSLQHLQFAIQRQDPNLEEKIKRTTELLINQIDSLSAMAEEFSSFAKMPEARLEAVDATRLLEDAVQLISKEGALQVDYQNETGPARVLADAHQLGRVFTNILKNASQAIPENRQGMVTIRLEHKNNWYFISIADNGKGIAPELSNRIFSPNFSTKNSGMGLGLAISKKIIEQSGGKISFSSKLNEGTTFVVALPEFNN